MFLILFTFLWKKSSCFMVSKGGMQKGQSVHIYKEYNISRNLLLE